MTLCEMMHYAKHGIWIYSGEFEGINVYESRWMPRGAGMALPGVGIVVYPGAHSGRKNIALLRHEFGHVLQARQTGMFMFYLRIGLPSLLSATFNGKFGHHHHTFWTEIWANQLAADYFRSRNVAAKV